MWLCRAGSACLFLLDDTQPLCQYEATLALMEDALWVGLEHVTLRQWWLIDKGNRVVVCGN